MQFTKSKKLLYISVIFFLISFTFICSFFFYKNNFFPFNEIKQLYISIFSEDYIDTTTSNNHFLKLEKIKSSETPDLQTLVLAFSKKTFDISKISNSFKSPRGGLCNIKDQLYVVSGLGKILSINTKNELLSGTYNVQDQLETIHKSKYIINDILCNDKKKELITLYFSLNFENYNKDLVFYDVFTKTKPYLFNLKSKSVLVRITINEKTKKTAIKIIWKSPNLKNNNGGRIVSKDFENFYMSFTDSTQYTNDNSLDKVKIPLAQNNNPNIPDGKIIKINSKTGLHNIFSYGHRNPQGLFMDNDSKIFQTEHGPKGGDEFNLLEKGKNYGWPLSSHGVNSFNYKEVYGLMGRHDKFTKPIFSWGPGIGISNLIKLKNFHNNWEEDFLILSLKNQSLYRVRLNENHVEFVEKIWLGHRLRDIAHYKDKIFIWTDDKKLIIIDVIDTVERSFVDVRQPLLVSCLSCHHLGVTNSTHSGPTLANIINKKAGSDPNFKYSDVLKKSEVIWDEENLISYLLNPQKFLPGNYMPYGVENIDDVKKIVKLLKSLENFQSN